MTMLLSDNTIVTRWWFALPQRMARQSLLMAAIWLDGCYLTAWRRAAIALPVASLLIGLAWGGWHFRFLVIADQRFDDAYFPKVFGQAVPLLIAAVIAGGFSAQAGLLLVLGYAAGDLAFNSAGDFYSDPRHSGNAGTLFSLRLPQLLSYFLFALLAVMPTICSRGLAGWLGRPGPRAAAIALTQACLVYGWVLAAPMVFRIMWSWRLGDAPITLNWYREVLNPWLPLLGAAVVAMRTWLEARASRTPALAANMVVTISGFAGRHPGSPYVRIVIQAFVFTALMAGFLPSIWVGAIVFGFVLAGFVVQATIMPRMPPWIRWARLAVRVPLILRMAAIGAFAFFIPRLLSLLPVAEIASNSSTGAFGAQIVEFLITLIVILLVVPELGRLHHEEIDT